MNAVRSAKPPAPDSAVLWEQFRSDGGEHLRLQLVDRYAGFARIMAAKLFANRTLPYLEFDDYLQYANVGLLQAVDRFDPGQGVKFETYAAHRITGAVLNGVEKSSDMQEQIAARRRILAERSASMRDGAAGDAAGDVFARLAELAIGLAVGFMLEDSGIVREGEEAGADAGYQAVAMGQLRDRLADLVKTLPERQRQVIHWHYLEDRRFEEIATLLALTRGRIAQLHREALERLRAGLRRTGAVDLSC